MPGNLDLTLKATVDQQKVLHRITRSELWPGFLGLQCGRWVRVMSEARKQAEIATKVTYNVSLFLVYVASG